MPTYNRGKCGCCGPAVLFVPVAIGEIYFDVESLYDDDAFIGLNITYRQDLSWIELYQTYSDDPSVDVAIASWSPPEADVRLVRGSRPGDLNDPSRWTVYVDVDQTFALDYDADGTVENCRAVGKLASNHHWETWTGVPNIYRQKYSIGNDGDCNVELAGQ